MIQFFRQLFVAILQALTKVPALFMLFLYFMAELWKSNLRVAVDVLRPHPKFSPALVAVPLCLKKNWSIALLANLVTLTPGTLSLDLSEDRRTLYIHTLYLDGGDVEAFVKTLKEGFEKRIQALEGAVEHESSKVV